MKIGAAYGAVSNSHDSIFSGGDHRLGNVVDLDLFGTHPLSGLHGVMRMRFVVGGKNVAVIRSDLRLTMTCLEDAGAYLAAT